MLAHGLSIFSVWMATPLLQWQLGGSLLLLISAHYYFRQWRSPTVVAIETDETGYRLLRRGSWHEATLQQAFVTEPLTVIQFRLVTGKRIAITLLADSLAPDDYRHLRIWLRWVRYENVHT